MFAHGVMVSGVEGSHRVKWDSPLNFTVVQWVSTKMIK